MAPSDCASRKPPWRQSREQGAALSSSRDALVVMMQPTDLGDFDHAATIGGMNLSALRAVHLERLVSSPAVVVVEVVGEDALQVPLGRRYAVTLKWRTRRCWWARTRNTNRTWLRTVGATKESSATLGRARSKAPGPQASVTLGRRSVGRRRVRAGAPGSRRAWRAWIGGGSGRRPQGLVESETSEGVAPWVRVPRLPKRRAGESEECGRNLQDPSAFEFSAEAGGRQPRAVRDERLHPRMHAHCRREGAGGEGQIEDLVPRGAGSACVRRAEVRRARRFSNREGHAGEPTAPRG